MELMTTDLFDAAFVRDNLMGPNCLRLLDELLGDADIRDAARLLDLGCGTGLTSMSLASRSTAQVVAYDLWIDPTENGKRFARCGFADRIVPVQGRAQAMPLARRYFDAVFCVDAYCYFGAAPGFLEYALAPFVKPGGLLALAIPGLKKDFTDAVPEALRPYWQEDINFYSAAWWADLFGRCPSVRLERCFSMACHDAAWRDWLACDHPYAVRDRDMMRAEAGLYFDTIGVVARVA
ncbi:MAG: SAM-dependent methyltransferase [Solidesulfovibrio sp. DCME]|uniref:SAM-dependent methyltransferase n=1 Tax=Solidesulfovibrio sp. DCME TaxID=3447380 RepID=UPI003D0D4DCA